MSVSRRWPSRPPADDDDDDDDDDARPSEKDNDTGGGRRRTSWHDPDHGCLASGARTWSGRARRLGPLPPCPALFSLFRSSLSSALPGQQRGRLERRGRGWLLGERPRGVRSQHARSASGASLPPPLATTHQRTHRQEPTKRTHPCACPALPPTCAHTHARSLARTPRHAVQVSAALVPQLQQPGGRIGIVTFLMGSMEDNTSGGKYGYRTSKAGVNMVGRSLAMD